MFLTPDSNKWDLYDKSYKNNVDSFLDHRGRIIPPSNYNNHTLVDVLDCLAVRAGNDNYIETISIDNACRPNGTRSMTRQDKTMEEYMNDILSTSAVGSCVEDTRSEENFDEVNVFLEEDAMQLHVASASSAYNPEIFCKMINDQVITSKFSDAVGSTMPNPQDPD